MLVVRFYAMFVLSISLVSAIAQSNTGSCEIFKQGIFHSYPKNSSDHFTIVREGEFQEEKNTKSGDILKWQIKWINNCTYRLKHISSSSKMNAETAALYKEHSIVYQIREITAAYYVFTVYLDNVENDPLHTDTVWLKEKPSFLKFGRFFFTSPKSSIFAPSHSMEIL